MCLCICALFFFPVTGNGYVEILFTTDVNLDSSPFLVSTDGVATDDWPPSLDGVMG